MTIRNLDRLFAPRSVAVFGASDRAHSVGATVWHNLSRGFQGTLYPVNPRLRQLGDVPAWPSVAALPAAPDLAVICTPPATVPGLIAELGAKGTRAAVVVTAGLDAHQKQAMLDAARTHTLRILGPNCIGMLVPHLGLNASFAHADAAPGSIAFVSQSGALVTAMLDWANSRQIGFSHFVSLGEHADVDFGDMLDFLGSDPKTRAILLYVESIDAPRKFMSAARAAARNKPVILVKAGRSAQGQKAAASHTGALAGSDEVFDAAISRAGMLRVYTLQHLFMAAELLARFRDNRSERLIVLTNGGGAGVMAADAAAYAEVELAPLAPELVAQLDAVLPGNWSRANPVDIIGDAPAQRYVDALKLLRQARDSAILFVQAPTAIVPSTEIAQALLPLAQERPPRVLGSWLGHSAVAEARALFRAGGVPDYDTPEEAVRAFSFLRQFHRHQAELMETPPAAPLGNGLDLPAIRQLVDFVLADGRDILTEPEAKELLRLAGIPVTPTRVVPPEAEAAVYAADTLGYPVVLKILSHDITHKSDVGGVRLNLHNAAEVAQAAQAMLERVAERQPGARIEGFTVQPMVRREHAHELILGASIDPLFGPVILFGQGGVSVEVVGDRALALPPLNAPLAEALIDRTRVAKLLRGYRDVPAADRGAITHALVAISQLLADVPEIAELDINPLVVNPDGAMALDARVRLCRSRPAGAAHFAIKPYPQDLVETRPWDDGRTLTLRPIRPEDEAQHLAFFQRLTPEDIRLRVFYTRRSIEHSELARLTQIDYDREIAFVATLPLADGGEETLGVVRGICDPDNDAAEFGVIVRSDLKGKRMGWILMDKLVRYLRANGTQRIVGTVLRENKGMLGLASRLGFRIEAHPEDHDLRHVELPLQAPPQG
ncbi:bifunctional acetate--CoA ligase family protein/GNAT family N-acetyltransferase [Aquabacterium sp. A08]|uniref:bifunctional acetate--CoA ligase family protein/GNAT family N-acetyltransferase n=1 Tax=Aquabacterium sp. A08 TaxID=2718532 RepID=UPI00141DEB5D|nr:bifunctional acetate--CoA ligase family protein/GNAT family N-acetyltransferase [Aquabacterium sp. A08]NIC40939.1 bifunctional acetate--CoA ligase family protein/GNAT family N-acetyltransferase [Aquabacterium sp. A08]